MKKASFVAILVFIGLISQHFAQTVQTSPSPARERVIVVGANPTPTPFAKPAASPTPSRVVVTNALPSPKPFATPRPVPTQTPVLIGSSNQMPSPVVPQNTIYRSMSFGQLKSRIAEAKRQMQARPLPTALTDTFLVTNVIRIAFYDWKAQKIDYAVLTKETFLAVDTDMTTVSSNGKSITIRTIRGNGVNTPVMILDDEGKTHLPLLVQYPIEKGGRHVETAYYISTHPGLVTPEVVNAG
ncbi:MAG TPA: hypothetical protein VGD05_07695, partial [Pyrinomonadaceae bacterium]